jgi:hypothetical protein
MGGIAKMFSPKLPKPEPVVRMPDPQDPAVLEAQRKKRRELLASGGRESTDLTGSYMNSTLGSN